MAVDIGYNISVRNEVAAPYVKRALRLFTFYPLLGVCYWASHGFCVNPYGWYQIPMGFCCPVLCFACLWDSLSKTSRGSDRAAAVEMVGCCVCWFSLQACIVFLWLVILCAGAISTLLAFPLECNLEHAAGGTPPAPEETTSPVFVETPTQWLYAEKDFCLSRGRHLLAFCTVDEYRGFVAEWDGVLKKRDMWWLGMTDRSYVGAEKNDYPSTLWDGRGSRQRDSGRERSWLILILYRTGFRPVSQV